MGTIDNKEDKVQWPVYYVSKALLDAETRYPKIERLSLTLVMSAKKLRPCFQAHPIIVRTGHPIEKALQKGTSSRMAIWSQELGEYGVEFQSRTAIKGQALADFVAAFTSTPSTDEEKEEKENDCDESSKKRTNDPIGPVWDLHCCQWCPEEES